MAEGQSHRAWLASEVERLTTLLRRANPDEIASAIDLLIEGCKSANEVSEARVAAMAIALQGVLAAALSAAVYDVLQGRVTWINPSFLVKPPEIARVCREREAALRAELARREAELERERNPAPPALVDEAARQRVANGLADMARSLVGVIPESEQLLADRRALDADRLETIRTAIRAGERPQSRPPADLQHAEKDRA